jgi:hypothetical protein
MKKYIIVILVLLSANCSFSQTDSVYAKVEITSVSINEHRQWIDTSIVVISEKFAPTGIINLGKIDEIEVGFQFELYKSGLAEKDNIILGIAFFTKNEGKWKLYQSPSYRSFEYKTIASKSDLSEKDIAHAGIGIQDLHIDYQTQIYIIKK